MSIVLFPAAPHSSSLANCDGAAVSILGMATTATSAAWKARRMLKTDMFAEEGKRASGSIHHSHHSHAERRQYNSLIQDLYLIFHQIVRFLAVGTYSASTT